MTFYTNVQNWGGKIYYRGIDSNGIHFKKKLDYNPTLFINSPEPTEYKTLEGTCLAPVECGNISCLLYTSPSPRDATLSRMPSSA